MIGTARIDGRPVVVCGDDSRCAAARLLTAGIAEEPSTPTPRPSRGAQRAADSKPVARGASVSGITRRSESLRLRLRRRRAARTSRCSRRARTACRMVAAALGPVAGYPPARLVAVALLADDARDRAGAGRRARRWSSARLGEQVDKQALGGADGARTQRRGRQRRARRARRVPRRSARFLSYLPSNVWERRAASACERPARPRRAGADRDRAARAAARTTMRADHRARCSIATRSSSSRRGYGRTQITGARALARPAGRRARRTIPRFYARQHDRRRARKLRRFVELCDTFHLPIVAFDGRARLHDRHRRRAGRHDPLRRRRRCSR